MLYLHCGWIHTGTSSFQAAIWEHRDALAEAGVLYPEGWGPPGAQAHHFSLPDLSGPVPGATVRRLQEFARDNRGQAVLVSSEGLTSWLAVRQGKPLLALLSAAQEVTPVRCLWTLRSMDEMITSTYLHKIATNRPLSSPEAFLAQAADSLPVSIATMRTMNDVAHGGASYHLYDPGGNHCEEILRAAGAPRSIKDGVMAHLRSGRRLNTRLTQKGAIMLLHLDVIEAKMARRLSRNALAVALHRGELCFPGDRPCVLFDPGQRHSAHEAALRASRKVGFDPYLELFEQHQVETSPRTVLEPGVITDEDLERLRDWAGTGAISP